jgi:hypothetical protein
VSAYPVSVDLTRLLLDATAYDDLVSGQQYTPGPVVIAPYQIMWLKAGGRHP